MLPRYISVRHGVYIVNSCIMHIGIGFLPAPLELPAIVQYEVPAEAYRQSGNVPNTRHWAMMVTECID